MSNQGQRATMVFLSELFLDSFGMNNLPSLIWGCFQVVLLVLCVQDPLDTRTPPPPPNPYLYFEILRTSLLFPVNVTACLVLWSRDVGSWFPGMS